MTVFETYRRMVQSLADRIEASADKRFQPSVERYDELFARFVRVVDAADAASLAWLVATHECAPVIPSYEAARAIQRLFDRIAI